MSVTVPTEDIGETRVKKSDCCDVVKTDEDRIEDYIKKEFGIDGY